MGFARATDRVFFAIYPDAGAAARIDDLAWGCRDDNFLKGRPLLTQHFHSTLLHVGDDFFPPPPELVDSLVRRAKLVEMPRFLVSFDYVESFSGGALVLRGQDGVAGLEMLQVQLANALGIASAKLAGSAFTPHVTLLRDQRLLPLKAIVPIEWTVTHFVLVHSLLGKTTHRPLAHFALG
jgi:2'-5' RNA ligase